MFGPPQSIPSCRLIDLDKCPYCGAYGSWGSPCPCPGKPLPPPRPERVRGIPEAEPMAVAQLDLPVASYEDFNSDYFDRRTIAFWRDLGCGG